MLDKLISRKILTVQKRSMSRKQITLAWVLMLSYTTSSTNMASENVTIRPHDSVQEAGFSPERLAACFVWTVYMNYI